MRTIPRVGRFVSVVSVAALVATLDAPPPARRARTSCASWSPPSRRAPARSWSSPAPSCRPATGSRSGRAVGAAQGRGRADRAGRGGDLRQLPRRDRPRDGRGLRRASAGDDSAYSPWDDDLGGYHFGQWNGSDAVITAYNTDERLPLTSTTSSSTTSTWLTGVDDATTLRGGDRRHRPTRPR